MIKVGNTQGGRNLVTHNSGNKGWQKHFIHNATYEEYFNTENSTCYGCAEDRGKAGADAADNKFSTVCFIEMKHLGNH